MPPSSQLSAVGASVNGPNSRNVMLPAMSLVPPLIVAESEKLTDPFDNATSVEDTCVSITGCPG